MGVKLMQGMNRDGRGWLILTSGYKRLMLTGRCTNRRATNNPRETRSLKMSCLPVFVCMKSDIDLV